MGRDVVTKAETTQLERIEEKVDSIVVLLMGAVDKPEQLGLVERMRNAEKFIAGMNRIKWLLIGTLIASIATLALRFWPGA